MFGSVGPQELILIAVIALIVFGPRKLPDIGKSVGKMMAEFRKASSDFKRTIEEEVEAEKRAPALPAATEAAPIEPVVTPASDAVAQTSAPDDTPVSENTPELGHEGTPRS